MRRLLRRLESRVGSVTMDDDVVRGLISVDNGNDTSGYFRSTYMNYCGSSARNAETQSLPPLCREEKSWLSFALLVALSNASRVEERRRLSEEMLATEQGLNAKEKNTFTDMIQCASLEHTAATLTLKSRRRIQT
jgi:hypothetical protein